jgi:multiple sugar transport system permease protein
MFTGRRGRDLRESLTGYLFIAPAIILIFIFGLFPVGFAVYVSLHKWLILRSDFRGIGNYVAALDNLAYIGLFAMALGALYAVVVLLRRLWTEIRADHSAATWALALPGALMAATVLAFFRWIYYQLPEFLDIAVKMRGLERTRELFIRLLQEAFFAETVFPHWRTFVWILLLYFVANLAARYFFTRPERGGIQNRFGMMWLALVAGIGLLTVTFQAVAQAYAEAFEAGTDPGIWPQVITVGSGVILLYLGWRLWRSAEHQDSNRSFAFRLLGAGGLIVAAVLLIMEIPTIVASGDPDLWSGLRVTVFFSLGTVPVQLSIALFLSVLLFQKLRGSETFRVIFFLPYITPAIASASVFRLMFSERSAAPVNTILSWFGIESQQWLRESDGIFAMLAGAMGVEGYPASVIPAWIPPDLSQVIGEWIVGPSMALTVIIMLSVWTFVGYNVVIYLAGLASIDAELTEAAEIDGASRWDVFRHITFPLLSPTTYFLSLIAVMGTFKAFNTIWVMRLGGALGTVDTFSVLIFEEFFNKTRYGYASALSFILFAIILGLTYFNNRVQGSRVFYG